jgi:ACR3 family arsenite efflux pump ArsB
LGCRHDGHQGGGYQGSGQQDGGHRRHRSAAILDRFLPLWIAMAAGLLPGGLVPGLDAVVDHVQSDGVTGDRRLLVGSLVLNWLVGPALTFALAWLARLPPGFYQAA